MKIQLCTGLFILAVISAYPVLCESQTTDTTFVKRVAGLGGLIQAIQTADGAYVSLSTKGDRSFVARKTKAAGQKIWERTISFPVASPPITWIVYYFYAIAQVSDGGYILGGRVISCTDCGYYDPRHVAGVLMKLRSNGDLEWKKEYNAARYFDSVVPVPDGGFVASSVDVTYDYAISNYVGYVILMRFTSAGNVDWNKSIIFQKPQPERCTLISDSSRGFILTCEFREFAGQSSDREYSSVIVMKLNDSGGIVWKKSVETRDFIFHKAAVTSDNGVVIAGACNNCNHLSFVQLKTNGEISRKAKYSLQPFRVDLITALIPTPDGGYAITGNIGGKTIADDSAFLLKINSSLQIVFLKTFNAGEKNPIGWGNIFASFSDGYLIFRSMGQGLLISTMKSNGTIPGCNLFHSGTALTIPFGKPKVKHPSTTEVSEALSDIIISDIAATSVTTSHAESVVCQ